MKPQPLRTVILVTLVLCLGVVLAPWGSGGQYPAAMLASGAALLLGCLLIWRQPEVRRLRRGPLVWSWVGLMLLALLSLLWTANRYSTGLWVTQWGLAGLAFYVAYVVAGEERGREWLMRAYLALAGLFCLAALGIFLTDSYDRLTGPFYWPNPAAAFIMPAIVLVVDRLRRAKGGRPWWWLAALVGLLACFMLTDSRAATMVLVIILALYGVIIPATRRFWILFVFSLGLSFGASLGLQKLSTFTAHHDVAVVPGSRFAEAAQGGATTGHDRLYFLQSAFEIWFAHPLLGTGAGTYSDVHPQYQQRVVSASTNAHNLYAQVLAELGIVGAVGLATVLLWLLLGVVRGILADPALLPVALSAATLVLHFGLDIDARYPSLLGLAAVLLGASYRQWTARRASASWRAPVLGTLLLAPLVSLHLSDVHAVQARVAQDRGDYDAAATQFGMAHEGLIYNPDYVGAEGIDWYTLALAGTNEAAVASDLAVERARQAEVLDPNDSQHHQLEGRALAARGDLPGAEAAFRTALRLDRWNHPDYALDLAAVQVRAGNVAGALSTAQSMLDAYPMEVVANRHADATLGPTLANLEALMGNGYLRQGDTTRAAVAAQRALQYDPKNLRGRALLHQLGR